MTNEQEVEPLTMPDTDGAWTTTRFVDPADLRHDMHVNIVNFQPGGAIPFPETHVMEHGLYVLEGKAVYLLNTDWVEVEAGDYMWLRAFCPQACYAGGPGRSATCSTRTSTGTRGSGPISGGDHASIAPSTVDRARAAGAGCPCTRKRSGAAACASAEARSHVKSPAWTSTRCLLSR